MTRLVQPRGLDTLLLKTNKVPGVKLHGRIPSGFLDYVTIQVLIL